MEMPQNVSRQPTSVYSSGLQNRISDMGSIAVCKNVVIAENENRCGTVRRSETVIPRVPAVTLG